MNTLKENEEIKKIKKTRKIEFQATPGAATIGVDDDDCDLFEC